VQTGPAASSALAMAAANAVASTLFNAVDDSDDGSNDSDVLCNPEASVMSVLLFIYLFITPKGSHICNIHRKTTNTNKNT